MTAEIYTNVNPAFLSGSKYNLQIVLKARSKVAM